MHQEWGSSYFQLRFGLRAPESTREEIQTELFQEKITLDEFGERLRTHANRPADAEMLKTSFEELNAALERYSRMMQAIFVGFDPVHNRSNREGGEELDEEAIDELAKGLRRKSKLFRGELMTVLEFIEEARIEKQLGCANLGSFNYPSASMLVSAVVIRLRESWESFREIALRSQTEPEYLYATTATKLFEKCYYSELPRAQDLYALLIQEQATVRMCLRSQEASSQKGQTIRAEQVDLSVNAERVSVHVEGRTEFEENSSPTTPVPQEHLFSVSSWSDLAIGIDEKGTPWALTPAPPLGGRFSKSEAFEIPLSGKRWKALLKLLGESTSGQQVDQFTLLRELGHLPAPSNPYAKMQADTEEIWQSHDVMSIEINKILKDLGRQLRSSVDGPTGRGDSCLYVENGNACSRFVVRYLVHDDADHLRFGMPPAPERW